MLLGALLAGVALGVCEIATEKDLIEMATIHPTDACVLTADIKLTERIEPIAFKGSLDGQGHWITSINFKFQTIFDKVTGAKNLAVYLFTEPTALENLGLEFAVDFTNIVGDIKDIKLGAVGTSTSSTLKVHDVVINGTIRVQEGSGLLETASIGAVTSESASKSTVLGPNVTSYCILDCRATKTCRVGGLAAEWNGIIEGVAVIASSISANGDGYVGGIVGRLGSASIVRSFADIGTLTAGGATHVGGLLGYFGGSEISDSYATVSTIEQSGDDAYVSPFVGEISSTASAGMEITRCYGWAEQHISASADATSEVSIGGLAAKVQAPKLTVSYCFARSTDVSIQISNGLYIGGLFGLVEPPTSSATGATFNAHDCWTTIQLSTVPDPVPMVSSYSVGGLVGRSSFSKTGTKLQHLDVNVDMLMSIPALSGMHFGALAGQANGTATEILLRLNCGMGYCPTLPIVAPEEVENGKEPPKTVDIDHLYVTGGWVVENGATDGPIDTIGWRDYASTSYSGLFFSNWRFHDNGYPTLSGLPVLNWDEYGNTFVNSKKSKWTENGVWVVPDVSENAPQLVSNKRCKQIGGNGMCVDCPWSEKSCSRCASPAHLVGDNSACIICPEGFYFDTFSDSCRSTDACAEGCSICGEDKTCIQCDRDTPYFDKITEDQDKACLSSSDCKAAGGIADNFAPTRQCRAPKELCDVESPGIPNCSFCTEVNTGDLFTCQECIKGHYLNRLQGAGQPQCLSKTDCKDAGGMLSSEGEGANAVATCVAMKCDNVLCTKCSEGPDLCTACRTGWTWDKENKECVLNTCLAGITAVENCAACEKFSNGRDSTACAKCEDKWYLVRFPNTEGMCVLRDECERANGMISSEGEGENVAATCVPMECYDKQCAECFEGPAVCTDCKINYLLDQREGPTKGKCIKMETCGGTSVFSENTCIALACATIDRCTSCQGADNSLCGSCDDGWSPDEENKKCVPNSCMHGPDKVENCVACGKLPDGTDSTTCGKCGSPYYLSKVSGNTQGTCVSEDQCKKIGGMLTVEGDDSIATCVPMRCSDSWCMECFEDASVCTRCRAGYLLDNRDGQNGGKCIERATCSGVAVPSGDTCAALKCAAIDHCTTCEGGDESLCKTCDNGWSTNDGKTQCIQDTCKQGATQVPNCAECSSPDIRVCMKCDANYYLNRLPGTQVPICILKDDCKDAGGMTSTTGAGDTLANTCVQMRCDDDLCSDCFEHASRCSRCKTGFVLDQRAEDAENGYPGSETFGECIANSECSGAAKRVSGACVYQACAGIKGCSKCSSSEEGECEVCEEPYRLWNGVCRDDCIAGKHSVLHCSDCEKKGEGDDAIDTRVCMACEKGYRLVERTDSAGTVKTCESANLTSGAIAGISIAVVVVVAAVILCVCLLVCCKKKKAATATA